MLPRSGALAILVTVCSQLLAVSHGASQGYPSARQRRSPAGEAALSPSGGVSALFDGAYEGAYEGDRGFTSEMDIIANIWNPEGSEPSETNKVQPVDEDDNPGSIEAPSSLSGNTNGDKKPCRGGGRGRGGGNGGGGGNGDGGDDAGDEAEDLNRPPGRGRGRGRGRGGRGRPGPRTNSSTTTTTAQPDRLLR